MVTRPIQIWFITSITLCYNSLRGSKNLRKVRLAPPILIVLSSHINSRLLFIKMLIQANSPVAITWNAMVSSIARMPIQLMKRYNHGMRSNSAHCSCLNDGPHRCRADRMARMTALGWMETCRYPSESGERTDCSVFFHFLPRFFKDLIDEIAIQRTWKPIESAPRPLSYRFPESADHFRTARVEYTTGHCSPC